MRSREVEVSCRSGGNSTMTVIGVELSEILCDLPLAIRIVQRIVDQLR